MALLAEAGIEKLAGALPVPELLSEASEIKPVDLEHVPFDEWGEIVIAGGLYPAFEALSVPQATGELDPFSRVWPALQPPYLARGNQISAQAKEPLAYQREAVELLVDRSTLLLADEPGTDKPVSVALAVARLIQEKKIRKALLLAPPSRHLLWLRTMAEWAPGLATGRVGGTRTESRRMWGEPYHVLVSDYTRAADDLPGWRLHGVGDAFELVIADSVLSVLGRTPQGLKAAVALNADRRWALAGGMPAEAEDWRTIFGFLLPGQPIGREETAVELQERLAPHLLRRTKRFLADELPNRSRREQWLTLDARQAEAYTSRLAEERHTLGQLGEAVTRTHIASTLGELNRATAFAQGSLDGIKVRALTDILEAIVAADDKAILFSQYQHRALEPLKQALHAFGAVILPETAGENERDQILGTFRRDPARKVLLAHLEARADGASLPASHIIHFDVSWNSARRLRAEQRFFPLLKPELPLSITEFWVAESHDSHLHRLLDEKNLLPSDLPQGTQPAELEDRITIRDWLDRVFMVGEKARSPAAKVEGSTGLLPGTTVLRAALEDLSEAEMREALAEFMSALGFPEAVELPAAEFEGVQMLAQTSNEEESVLVRLLRQDNNVGIAEGRNLLEALDAQGQADAAYLVTTSDFTSACKGLAEESEGRLALVSGSEFFRHLRILGWM